MDDLAVPMSVEGRDTSSAQLTRLEVLPPTPLQKEGQSHSQITVLATYVSLGHASYTVVARWELQNTLRDLNPAILAMAAGKAEPNVKQVSILLYME